MAIVTLVSPNIWMGPYDVTGDLSGAALKYGKDQKDATTFGMLSKARKSGLFDTTAEHHGYWNGGAPGDLMFGQIGLNIPVTIAPANNNGADGELAYSFPADQASYEVGGPIGDMLPFTVKAEGAGDRLVLGTLMMSSQDVTGAAIAKTSSGTGVVRLLGAVAAPQKLYIAIHVIAGTGNLTVLVKSAVLVGFGSPTTRYTSATYTGIGSEWGIVAAPITDTYYRVDWTISGGTPSFQFAVLVGII